jgi:hypothetical protein
VELETNQLPTRKNCCQIRENNRLLSGNWRKQILEGIQIETSQKMAATNKTFWGQSQEEIEWPRMRKTSDVKKDMNE